MTLFKGVEVNKGDKVRIVYEGIVEEVSERWLDLSGVSLESGESDIVSIEVIKPCVERPDWLPLRPGDVLAFYRDDPFYPRSTAVVREDGEVVGRHDRYLNVEDFVDKMDRRGWKGVSLEARCAAKQHPNPEARRQ